MIDISPLVSPSIAVWPGDVAFSRDVALDMNNGDNLTLSAITSTLHLGAHTDAPNHYAADGEGISSRPLERYYGPAQVIEARVERGARLAGRRGPALHGRAVSSRLQDRLGHHSPASRGGVAAARARKSRAWSRRRRYCERGATVATDGKIM